MTFIYIAGQCGRDLVAVVTEPNTHATMCSMNSATLGNHEYRELTQYIQFIKYFLDTKHQEFQRLVLTLIKMWLIALHKRCPTKKWPKMGERHIVNYWTVEFVRNSGNLD